jgi:L-fucose isomerase
MDVRLYHPDIDVWDLCNSGQHATWYATRSDDPVANFAHVSFHPAMSLYFKAGGASVEFDAAPGPLTFARLGLWDDHPYLIIIPGEVADLPAAKRHELNAMTDPTWPHVHARLECSSHEMFQVFPCNHLHATPGDQVAPLVQLAEMSGIDAIVLGRGREDQPIWERIA